MSLRPTRFEDLLEDPALDALVIATPVFTHFDLASLEHRGREAHVRREAARGVGAQADELIAGLGAGRRRAAAAATPSSTARPCAAVKQLIDRGELGEIYFITSSRVNLGIHQSDVSVLWDLAPHDFSMLLHWLGELPVHVSAVGRDSIVPGVADVAFVNLAFPTGVLANVELSWLAPSKLRRTVVVGSEKMVLYDDGDREPVRVFDQGVVYRDPETFGQYQLSYRTGDIVSPKLDTTEPIGAEMDDFLDAVRAGEDRTDMLGLARDVVLLVECAEASLREGGEQRRVPARAITS